MTSNTVPPSAAGTVLVLAVSIFSSQCIGHSRAQSTFPENTFGRGPGEAFVHLFGWTWDDVGKECEEWLGPKGYKAVQISPANEHQVGISWDVQYRPVSFKLESRSGNEAQLKSMIDRCRAAGVDIYADIVINQFAGPWGGVGIAGTPFANRTYGDLFSPDDFHHFPGNSAVNCGVDNYENEYNVQYCDLLGMPDVCTGCNGAQQKIVDYINHLHSLGVAGIRMDAAKHQNASELQQVLNRVSPSLYRFLEVFSNAGEAVQPPEYYELGQVTCFAYGFNLGPKFAGISLLQPDLETFGESWGMMPSENAVVFIDNHDTQRSVAPLTFQTDTVLYVLANVFMLAWPYGYPKVMSSFYFTDQEEGPPSAPVHGRHSGCGDGMNWVCEHRWPAVANMVNWRKSAGDSPVKHFQIYDGSSISFCRGDKACVAINKHSYAWTVTLSTDIPPGVYCDVSRDDGDNCPTVTVGADGRATVTIQRMSALAFHVGKRPVHSNQLFTAAVAFQGQPFNVAAAGFILVGLALITWRIRSIGSPTERESRHYVLLA